MTYPRKHPREPCGPNTIFGCEGSQTHLVTRTYQVLGIGICISTTRFLAPDEQARMSRGSAERHVSGNATCLARNMLAWHEEGAAKEMKEAWGDLPWCGCMLQESELMLRIDMLNQQLRESNAAIAAVDSRHMALQVRSDHD